MDQQNFAGDLGQRIFDISSLLKIEYCHKFVPLFMLFLNVIINFHTIDTNFLEQQFDEEENQGRSCPKSLAKFEIQNFEVFRIKK